MASRKHAISATVPHGLKVTPGEATQLRNAFRSCVVDVFSTSRPSEAAPFPEVNISRPRKPKTSAKKSGSAKKGKKR